jgi:hypothetical protein
MAYDEEFERRSCDVGAFGRARCGRSRHPTTYRRVGRSVSLDLNEPLQRVRVQDLALPSLLLLY